MKEHELPKMLTVKDIQEHFHNKVYALVRLKGFPKIKLGGTYLIPNDKYMKWIDEHIKNQIVL